MRPNRRLLVVLLAAIAFGPAPQPLRAQESGALITGTIRGQGGHPLPGARASFGPADREAAADSAGR